MSFYLFPLLLGLSFITTILFTPLIIRFSKRFNFYDSPNHRKHHKAPIPLLGGVAIYIGFIVPILILVPLTQQTLSILVGATLILLLGIVDDLMGLSAIKKLMVQLLIALFTVRSGLVVHFISNPLGELVQLEWLSMPLTALWIVGVINALNLIDGVDGLASGITAISSGMLAIIAYQTGQVHVAMIILILMGACSGFLFFNFAPAKIFLGDSGSMLLGYVLATTSILGVMKTTITLSLLLPFLLLGIPITDTLFSIFRRFKNKQAIFQADMGHLHHRLLDRGFSARQISLSCYFLSFLLGICALGIGFFETISVYIVLVSVLIGGVVLASFFMRGSFRVPQFFTKQLRRFK